MGQVSCSNSPVKTLESLHVREFAPAAFYPFESLPKVYFHAAYHQNYEWQNFLTYLFDKDEVAIYQHENCEFVITPPAGQDPANWDRVAVAYRFKELPIYGEVAKNVVVHCGPRFLYTHHLLHKGWTFGALAELIDNASDANASKLHISIQMEFYERAQQNIPVLSVIDDGRGMSHLDVTGMVGIGSACPTEHHMDRIGIHRFGFLTGSMQLGKDVVVLTQSKESRSIEFVSHSYNENNKEIDIPIITYRKDGGWRDFDLEVHSESEAEERLKSIMEYLPFNEYTIRSKFARFGENGTGTHIYIYNLAKWGSEYRLAWDEKCDDETDLKKKRDIWIRSRWVRKRQGQISREVPLDYSLHAYLEVMFLNPRVRIYVQGTMVRMRPVAKSLNKTKVVRDVLMGKNVELTLGRSQVEKERGNYGIFLYWCGRLIEAYKRVGAMVRIADMGCGIIGVMDVTNIMNDNDEVLVAETKQRFQDCDAFDKLEQWLGHKVDEYWDENFDTLELRDNSKSYTPDHKLVQCNRWRIYDPNFNAENLSADWCCFMPPFKGLCDTPEQGLPFM
ncbi:uncharacterized protein LOC131041428 isoform X2 [Cryptomeria japonica]|uniref:uncharacterized protein LOC131041428 isoform X2 n=1 Tax=Cryptomeria japonica TaxID=3369 RepID=UPI0027D9E7BE|nr:uncharacterized protein LOC131041428 isoform X2 [Cryptomeria japonica]XP_057830502.2 uncharacterized protein LOC131041428 isoform X2 [Cryptomeria japonica]XP_057830503.2 uncharacterized protein LOC131041428 isoform X2 [Cryptomeria japonica]XP_057830504.2 uncharacterized protein LOC131041428 isoform X2 [Cryptomeria japonica]XP_057830506.2 uncharacterized protein LOC131041428 isoform X2 [Cryptomeria japonica]XP_057830507.2 uncharacterized protein LOC131041428 isoform X2 [Cryptomeria japonica]